MSSPAEKYFMTYCMHPRSKEPSADCFAQTLISKSVLLIHEKLHWDMLSNWIMDSAHKQRQISSSDVNVDLYQTKARAMIPPWKYSRVCCLRAQAHYEVHSRWSIHYWFSISLLLFFPLSLYPSEALKYPPARRDNDSTLFRCFSLPKSSAETQLQACYREAEQQCSACLDYIIRHFTADCSHWLTTAGLADHWVQYSCAVLRRWRYSHLTRPPRGRLPNELARPGAW